MAHSLFTPLLEKLVDAFCCLPSVGPKSAQRMAFYLLQHNRAAGNKLAACLQSAMRDIKRCQSCNTFSETDQCMVCVHPHRNHSLICIVESPIDASVIEQTGYYRGVYFVLNGPLSPIDGFGADEIGIPLLKKKLDQKKTEELIVATNATVEGEATAHYIADLAKAYRLKVSRLAQGVPMGSELEFLGIPTLIRALTVREAI